MERISPARRAHILDGDGSGGGHLWPGAGGKTPFPKDWTADDIIRSVAEVAVDSASTIVTMGSGRKVMTGTRNGIEIRVVVEQGGEVVNGYPLNQPRNRSRARIGA